MTPSASAEAPRCLPPNASARAHAIDAALHQLGVWHLTSTNPPVGSCREAAHQRRRLGHVGIPLCDELKSLVLGVSALGPARRFVVLHARGHQRLDLKKASALLGGALRTVPPQVLRREFDLEYGTVNPVAFRDRADVLEIFDLTLLAEFYPPHTVMTNCGDLRQAVELRAADIVSALGRQARVADIVLDADRRLPTVRTLGILTGNSPESGLLLWERVNQRIRADRRIRFRGDPDFPHVIVHSVPGMGTSMELERREHDVRRVVVEAVEDVCRAGADIVGIACNTTQYFAAEVAVVCAERGAQFVDLAVETGAYLRRRGIQTLDLLGIRPVTDLEGFSGFTQALAGLDVRVPTARQLATITQLAYEVKTNVAPPGAINRLRDLVHGAATTDTAVVALTELPILLAKQGGRPRSGRRFIDTLDILADRMADLYLADRVAVGGA